MIRAYTGVPGSGKSLHSIRLICAYLQEGKNVIANFPLKVNKVKKNRGRFFYVSNDDFSTEYLLQFSKTMHRPEEENQTLIMIDEASVKFNSRTFNAKDRLGFCSFFAQHRKYGFNVVLVCQNLRQIDRQIRDEIELEVKHRKLNHYAYWRILPFPLFVAIERNVGINDKNQHDFFTYSKRYGNLYDTFFEFDHTIAPKCSAAVQALIDQSEIVPAFRTNVTNEKKRTEPHRAHGVPEAGPQSTAGSARLLDISHI